MIHLADTHDREAIAQFIEEANLSSPVHSADFLIEKDDEGHIIAVIALEIFATNGWLRSLVVEPTKWTADRMLQFFQAVFEEARRKDLETLYLQTNGYDDLLMLLGFEEEALHDVPVDIRQQMATTNPHVHSAMKRLLRL